MRFLSLLFFQCFELIIFSMLYCFTLTTKQAKKIKHLSVKLSVSLLYMWRAMDLRMVCFCCYRPMCIQFRVGKLLFLKTFLIFYINDFLLCYVYQGFMQFDLHLYQVILFLSVFWFYSSFGPQIFIFSDMVQPYTKREEYCK